MIDWEIDFNANANPMQNVWHNYSNIFRYVQPTCLLPCGNVGHKIGRLSSQQKASLDATYPMCLSIKVVLIKLYLNIVTQRLVLMT